VIRLTAVKKKYKVGDKVLCVKSSIGGSYDLIKGLTYEIIKGVYYPTDYDFKGYKEVGWQIEFIEDIKYFKLIPKKITNWQKELEE